MPAEQAVADAPTLNESTPPAPEPQAAQAPQAERAPAVNNQLLHALGIPDDVAKQVFAAPAPASPPKEPKEPEETDGEQKPQGEPEPEAPAETTPGQEEGDEDDGDSQADEPAAEDHPDWAKRRIGKLTGQREKARQELEAANAALAETRERVAQLEAQPGVTVMPTTRDPLADVQDLETLAQRVQRALLLREHAMRYPDGVTVNEGTKEERFQTPEELRESLIEQDAILFQHAPAKEQSLRLQMENDQLAYQIRPDLFKKGSKDYQDSQAAQRYVPGLANHPAKNVFIAYYLKGFDADVAEWEKSKRNGNANGEKPVLDPRLTAAHQAKIPPLAPVTAAPPNTAGGGKVNAEKQIAAAKQQVMQEAGSRDSIVALVRAQREQRERGGNPRGPVLT